MSTVIKVENLSKKYIIRHSTGKQNLTFRDAITLRAKDIGKKMLHPFVPLSRPGIIETSATEEFWALKDVSFEVKQGDRIGIIGRNGAGKSTLLKILSRITEPTEGKISLKGRVASMLEVGTGFHSELTGRENIFLNGAILGMSKTEIKSKFDEIVAFSDVEKFLDTPVKRYSSGMHVRLAFAVAAHLETEILLVDEVLAVGDAAFQKKCIGKMSEVSSEGRTILFVSHQMAAIRHLCQQCLFLRSGELKYKGDVFECIGHYLQSERGYPKLILSHITDVNSCIKVKSITVNGSPRDEIDIPSGCDLLKIDVVGIASRSARFGLEANIFDMHRTPLAFYSPGREKGRVDLIQAGEFHLVSYINLPRMTQGKYCLDLHLTDPGFKKWLTIERAVLLNVEGTSTATGRVLSYDKGVGWVLLTEGKNDS